MPVAINGVVSVRRYFVPTRLNGAHLISAAIQAQPIKACQACHNIRIAMTPSSSTWTNTSPWQRYLVGMAVLSEAIRASAKCHWQL